MIPRKYRLKDGSIYWHKLYFDLVPRWMAKYAPPLGYYNYAYYLYQPHKYFIAVYDEYRYFIQRGSRGFSDRDAWSLDYYLCSWMPQALRQLQRNTHGYPIGMSKKTWNLKIDRMVRAFEIARRIIDYPDLDSYAINLKQFRKDFNVFKMHFFSLWD